jgi:predicted nucleotidyltransferase
VVQARDAISAAKQQEGSIKELDEDMWQRIYRKRIPEISLMNSCFTSPEKETAAWLKALTLIFSS